MYGLLGKRLSHSMSKEIHEEFSDINYDLIELNDIKNLFIKKDFTGINVTIPYKKDVIKYLHYLDKTAERIGVVNTVINKNGVLYGYNTDYDGFLGLLNKFNVNLKDKNVLILGNGATSRTVECVCVDASAHQIKFLARNPHSKNELHFRDIESVKHYDIIINTTPSGMYPNNYDDTLIDLNSFSNLEMVIDLIYNPLNTKTLLKAKKMGVKAINGLYMLIHQAYASHKLFLSKDIESSTVDRVFNKLKIQTTNIVLIGMPMSGKTTIGLRLSKRLNKRFIDVDLEIEKQTNKSIEDIFKEKGEKYFRQLEKKCIESISLKRNLVISTGGGVVKDESNISNLKQNGIIIYIDRDIENLVLKKIDKRPLLKNISSLKKLYNERESLYNNYSDIKIENNKSIKNVIFKIEVVLDEYFNN